MALRSDWSDNVCPIARSLDVLGDPWNILILREIFTGTCRFDALHERLNVADTVLSRRLGQLVEAGLLRPEPYAGSTRHRYDYVLTKAGRDTLPVLHALARWGDVHLPHRPEMKVYCTRCGKCARGADWCTTCAKPLAVGSTAWRSPGTPRERIVLAEV